MKSVVFIAATLMAFCPGRLSGEMMYGFTPEWLAHESSLTFVGVPLKVTEDPLVGQRALTTVQFRIEKRIKGPLSVGDIVTVTSIDYWGATDQMDLKSAVVKKRHVLVMATIAENTFPETDGRYIFLPHFRDRPVVYADEPVKGIYMDSGKTIRDFAELLRRIEIQSNKEKELNRRYWRGKIIPREMDGGKITDAGRDLFAGSAVVLLSIDYKEEEKDERHSEKSGEQGDAVQPATAVDSKAEGREKPKPESEGRSQ